jgi:hypothetical protein
MFWLFWQLVGVCLAIGGGMLALVILYYVMIAPFWLVAWIVILISGPLNRRRANVARAEAAHEERLRVAAP